jgi:glutamyl-tRNA reductase
MGDIMQRIAIAGLNFHDTDLSGLECVRRPEPGRENAFLRGLSDVLGASELVFLSTCNRVEVIYAREEGEAPDASDLAELRRFFMEGDAGQDFVLRTGRDAIEHLFRVACSLDSLVLGEDQIIAQVRKAYGRSADIGLTGNLLGPLFHHALHIGKKVRSETDLARHPFSVVNLAVLRLREAEHSESLITAVVGAGEMGGLLARALSAAGLPPAYLVNRTPETAARLAGELGARAVPYDAFLRGEIPVDVVITATGSTSVLFSPEALADMASRSPRGRGLLGIDLSVPRNLPAVEGVGGTPADVEVVDLDALRRIADANRLLRADAAHEAELLVGQKLERFIRRFREDAAAPVVTELIQATDEILARELRGLLSGRLSHLDDADRRAIERWARATFGRLMHPSVSAVKRMAAEHDDGSRDEDQDEDENEDENEDPLSGREDDAA